MANLHLSVLVVYIIFTIHAQAEISILYIKLKTWQLYVLIAIKMYYFFSALRVV